LFSSFEILLPKLNFLELLPKFHKNAKAIISTYFGSFWLDEFIRLDLMKTKNVGNTSAFEIPSKISLAEIS